jgi:site-specific DNA-methyltransferase (cytosine-N4-specific)
MPLPSETQMLLPLLHSLQECGGSARPCEIYDAVADQLGVTTNVRNMTSSSETGKGYNLFERRVRWTRQTAVLKGLISNAERSIWSLTSAAEAKLGNMRRGTLLTFAIHENGALIWGNVEDAVAVVEPQSVDLLLTSPPFPLLNPKEYGNPASAEWVDWMMRLIALWQDRLTPTGSMMIHMAPSWKAGQPAQELHVERLLVKLEDTLGIHLLQKLYWHSPTRMPAPLPWVGKMRARVTTGVEPILWVSPNTFAKGRNQHVLRPYSKGGLRAIENARTAARPGGYAFGESSFQDRGGSIPHDLIQATPTGKEEARYRRALRAQGIAPHPAIMPGAVARFCILLATDPEDMVYDPFAGSGTVVVEALKAGRRAMGSDRAGAYLDGAVLRAEAEGMQMVRTYDYHRSLAACAGSPSVGL